MSVGGFKSHRHIERVSCLHRGKRVEHHLPVAELTRYSCNLDSQPSTEACSPERRPRIQPLHFADIITKEADANTTGNSIADLGEKKRAVRRAVHGRQCFELSGKILKAQIDLERRRIFLKQNAAGRKIDGRLRFDDFEVVHESPIPTP